MRNKQTDNNENLDTSLFQMTEKQGPFQFLAQVVSIEVDDEEGLVSSALNYQTHSGSTIGTSRYRTIAKLYHCI